MLTALRHRCQSLSTFTALFPVAAPIQPYEINCIVEELKTATYRSADVEIARLPPRNARVVRGAVAAAEAAD